MEKEIKDLIKGDTFCGHKVLSVSSNDAGTYTVVVEGDITNIEKDYFKDGETCKLIKLPSSVNTISDDAFENCGNLNLVDLSNMDATVINNMSLDFVLTILDNAQTNTPLILPNGATYNNYKTASPSTSLDVLKELWNQFEYTSDGSEQGDLESEMRQTLAHDTFFYLWDVIRPSSTSANAYWRLSKNSEEKVYWGTASKTIYYYTYSGNQISINSSYTNSNKVEMIIDTSNITSHTFDADTKKGTIVLTNNSIPDNLFAGQKDIEAVFICSGITSIGKYAFRECEKMRICCMTDDITTLGEGTFYACASMSILRLSDNITVLPKYCFWACTWLRIFKFPSTLKTISTGCFGGCYHMLEAIYYYPNGMARIDNLTLPYNEADNNYREIYDTAYKYHLKDTDYTVIKTFPKTLEEFGDELFGDSSNFVVHPFTFEEGITTLPKTHEHSFCIKRVVNGKVYWIDILQNQYLACCMVNKDGVATYTASTENVFDTCGSYLILPLSLLDADATICAHILEGDCTGDYIGYNAFENDVYQNENNDGKLIFKMCLPLSECIETPENLHTEHYVDSLFMFGYAPE